MPSLMLSYSIAPPIHCQTIRQVTTIVSHPLRLIPRFRDSGADLVLVLKKRTGGGYPHNCGAFPVKSPLRANPYRCLEMRAASVLEVIQAPPYPIPILVIVLVYGHLWSYDLGTALFILFIPIFLA